MTATTCTTNFSTDALKDIPLGAPQMMEINTALRDLCLDDESTDSVNYASSLNSAESGISRLAESQL